MNVSFDNYGIPLQSNAYLAKPNRQPICALNGIDRESFSSTLNTNDISEVSMDVYRFICIDGKEIETNGYQYIEKNLKVRIDQLGWFLIKDVSENNDGIKELKTISLESVESEMVNHNLNGLKINRGTTDSYEMLVDGNVEIIDGVEFAKEQIKFYNPNNPDLSLLDIILKVSDMYGWTIGYIDDKPKTYRTYKDGKLVEEKQVKLADEIGTFEIDTQNVYQFITQELSQFFSCVFIFDYEKLEINAYRPENFGKDTNINIGFRNLQQSNSITIDESNLFTRYIVNGGNDLNILQVNFGSNFIEDLTCYMNEKFMSKELVRKYQLWLNDVEIKRPEYIEQTILFNKQMNIINELKNRLPLDDCSTDWSTFPDDKLLETQKLYQAQLKGYEDFYVDSEGNFDKEALDASPDANDYYQIKDVILPSIQIEIDNRNLPSSEEEKEYIDSYKTDWKLYGLDELSVKLESYKNEKKILEEKGYDKPYTEESGHTQDYHEEMYKKYLEIQNQLNPDFIGSCMEAYNKRKQEIDDATALSDTYNEKRTEIAKVYDKAFWKNGEDSFTNEDLALLSHLYIDNTYVNENMFLTSYDDPITAIDEQLKLLTAAQEDLEIASQPQYIYDTNLDDFISLNRYENYSKNLNKGDFIYLGVRDDYVVKLRIMSISRNHMTNGNNLNITFSNMLRSRSKRNDFVSILNMVSGRGKEISYGNSNDFLENGSGLTSGIIQKILASSEMINKLNQLIQNGIVGNLGDYVTIGGLNAEMIKVTNIIGKNGFFEYLQSKLIVADKIVADSGNFKDLSALVAMIDNLIAGNVSAELGHLIKLTAENVQIDEAVIRDLIASQITVSMLKAGDISADSFHIVSDDGGLAIVGNTMQFKDANGNIRIQIGRDKKNEFTFVLYDETGKGVLIDSTGIKESAIEDGLIKNDMIAPGTIEQDRLAFRVVETDENGKVDWGNITANGKGLDVEFGTIQESITKIENDIQNISNEKPITVQLDKEMYLIPCDKDGAVINNELIEIHFTAYKGVDKIPSKAQIDVLPSGMTLGKNEPSTTTSDGIIVFNVAQKAELNNVDSGSINIKFVHEKREITKSFSWMKLKENNGQQGDAARIFTLESDVSTVIKDDAEVFVPNKITFSSFYRDGKNTERFVYNGRFIIQESTNGVLFENKYLSNVDESSYTYTISNPDVKIIKCNLYASGSVTQLLDIKSVSVLSDISQETIENINKQISSVSSKIDAVEKSITNKVWQSDITTQINNYDGTTVKTLRDQLAEQKIELGKISTKVSDVESTFSNGLQTLTEKVSKVEQDAEGFKQTVEKNYVAKTDKIGARNLLRNSKTLIFENYNFTN